MASPALATRSFVVLSYADELLASPELLDAYGRTFGAADDVTLAIYAPGPDGEQIAAALAPHADIDADLMLLAVRVEDAPAVAEGVDYVYTRRAPLQVFAGLPHTDEPAELRRAHGRETTAPRIQLVSPAPVAVPFVAPPPDAADPFAATFLEFARLAQADGDGRFPLEWDRRFPCLDDATATTGFDRHYVYHPAWAARVVAERAPALHVDISSTLHFASQLSAFVPTAYFDYRPADLRLDNLVSGAVDLTALPWDDGSVDSLSCMHTVEHIGLGRYGDPLDPAGDRKSAAELARVLAPGGSLLFVAPVGAPQIMFNAHRIYAYEQVLELFPSLTLREFALIPEHGRDGGLIRNADPALVASQRYGCGCFHFTC
jgi:SAM-dependent methyltransferase